MSKIAEKMAFNPDLVNAAHDAIGQLGQIVSDVTLADHLGELHCVHAQLGKVLQAEKAKLVARGVETLHGVRWQVNVRAVTSNVVDQSKLAKVIDLDQFRTEKHSVRVTFKTLY